MRHLIPPARVGCNLGLAPYNPCVVTYPSEWLVHTVQCGTDQRHAVLPDGSG